MDQIPYDAVYVGRPTAYGNPFVLRHEKDRDKILIQYATWLMDDKQRWLRDHMRRNLRGRHLVCWCSPKACHADIVLIVANSLNDEEANRSLWEEES